MKNKIKVINSSSKTPYISSLGSRVKETIDMNPPDPARSIIYGPSKLNSSSYSDYNDYLRDLSIENSGREFLFNEREAEKARNWQEEMSNTSHQREVQDLIKAGLNPVLSANNGATAYSASSASASGKDPTGAMANVLMTKMNNSNAVKIAKLQNANNLKMANISAQASLAGARMSSAASLAGSLAAASASRYASDQQYLASIYGSDRSKYGYIDSMFGGLFGNNSGTSVGKTISDIKKNKNYSNKNSADGSKRR